MKPILIAAALFASTFTKTFATDSPRIEPSVQKTFQATFANAKEVDWSVTQDLYKAVFFLNEQYVTAYFNQDGTLQATTRHITASNLPMLLQASLKSNYKDQWVSDVFEVTNDGTVQYYVTLENADQKIILKSASNTWNTFKKLRKN
jgi:hypothetical protein